jgi:hypothetical protein
MSKVLEAFGLLDFTMLRPVISRYRLARLLTFMNRVFFRVLIFFLAGRGKLRILNQWILEHDCIHIHANLNLKRV